MQTARGVDDDDVAAACLCRLDRVVGDSRRVTAALGADEVSARTLRPDLELLFGGRAERVGRRDDDGMSVLCELRGELADRRRLAGPVDADDEDHGGPVLQVERRRLAEERRDLVRERIAELAELAARLQPLHELRRRRNPDVGLDQRLLEPLPREVVSRLECGDRDLLGERAARLRQRVAQAGEHPCAGFLALRLGTGLPQQLRPASRHRATLVNAAHADRWTMRR